MNLIELPPGGDEEREVSRGRGVKKTLIQTVIALAVAVTISFSLAGTISIGNNENFELGQRSYDVGTCATGRVQIIHKTSIVETGTVLSQFTVSGISPTICDGRVIRILPFDTSNSPIPIIDTADPGLTPDQTYVDIFVAGGEFLASSPGTLSNAVEPSLTRSSNGSTSIKKSTWSPGGTTIDIYSGGQGRTLKSTDNDLEGLAISFQVRISPTVAITGYGRTDIELRIP